MPTTKTLFSRARTLPAWISLGVPGMLVFIAWLSSALQKTPPLLVSRGLVLFFALTVLIRGGSIVRSLVLGRIAGIDVKTGRWLLAIFALGVASAFIGLGFEIGGRYFGDEGTFLANAQKMNQGRLLRPWFIYPHLLYSLDAIALWTASLFPEATEFTAGLWGVRGDLETAAWVTRSVCAAMIATTPLIVFHMVRRIADRESGLVAATIAALSPVWFGVGHQSISDIPAAFFATACLAVCAEILVSPSPRLWVLAGLAAGFAAGSKYPAGLVALAIFGVWIRDTWRLRKPTTDLALATLSAIAAFLLSTPSMVVFHRQLFGAEGPDMFFGARLYAEAGWAGVVRSSNLLFYGERLTGSFGLGLILIAACGLILLPRTVRSRWLWLLPFPLVYFSLLLAMNVALLRNLLPVLPVIAALLGCGFLSVWRRIPRWMPGSSLQRPARVALALIGFLPLAWVTTSDLTRFARPTTRDLAAEWMQANLPAGSLIVKEHYTPVVRHPLFARQPRFVVKLWPDAIRSPGHDFVLVASEAYDRYLTPHNLHKKEFKYYAQRYRELFDELDLIREFAPGRWRAGPTLKLFSVDPIPAPYSLGGTIPSAEARVSNDTMRKDDGTVRWQHEGTWAVFKGFLEPGEYRFRVEGERVPNRGTVRVATREGHEIGLFELEGGVSPLISLESQGKYFAQLTLPPGTQVTAVTWLASPPAQ